MAKGITWSELEPGDCLSYVSPDGRDIYMTITSFLSDSEIKVMNIGHVDRGKFSHGDLALLASNKFPRQVGADLRVLRDNKTYKFSADKEILKGVLAEIASKEDSKLTAANLLVDLLARLKPVQTRVSGFSEDDGAPEGVLRAEHQIFVEVLKAAAKLQGHTAGQILGVTYPVWEKWVSLYVARATSLGLNTSLVAVVEE